LVVIGRQFGATLFDVTKEVAKPVATPVMYLHELQGSLSLLQIKCMPRNACEHHEHHDLNVVKSVKMRCVDATCA
jgi:hypothetical protein